MERKDLQPHVLEGLTWESGKLSQPLDKVRQSVVQRCQTAIRWYFHRSRYRRIGCRLFRVSAILLTAFAGLLPLINSLHQSSRIDALLTVPAAAVSIETVEAAPEMNRLAVYRPLLNPLWSALALALVAALLALDRFYGATSGWVRYILTAQQLTTALDEFQVDYETQRLGWGWPEPTPEQAQAALVTMQAFLARVNSAVQDETMAWATEFTEALKQLETQTRGAGFSPPEAALQITVKNGDKCEEPWTLTVGSSAQESRLGREASVKVPPGMYVVRITGMIGGKAVQAERAIEVAPGEIQALELVLA
jgi:hypothetical protein